MAQFSQGSSPKDKEYEQKNYTKQCYVTNRQNVLILLPPNSQLTNSNAPQGAPQWLRCQQHCMVGHHSGQEPGFQNFERPN